MCVCVCVVCTYLAYSQIRGSEVVAPLRHTVGLVDACKGHGRQFGRCSLAPPTPEGPRDQSLRREQQYVHPSLCYVSHDALSLRLGLVGV